MSRELDFTEYSKLVIETESGEIVCEITQDDINIMDGYVGRCVPLEKETMSQKGETLWEK